MDKVVLTDQLVADLSQPGLTNAQVPALAVKVFALAAASSGGAMFNTESPWCIGQDHSVVRAKDGMVLNFGAVRITDGDTGAAECEVA